MLFLVRKFWKLFLSISYVVLWIIFVILWTFSKLEAKVQELQSRLDAELDARDKISQTSHSVQSKITQLEKQVWDLTEELKKESDAHAKTKKSHSDLQKVGV